MKKKAIIGIDVGKFSLDVSVIIDANLEHIHYAKFENNNKGFPKLLNWIEQLGNKAKYEMHVCMEHTGTYTLELCCFLQERGIHKYLENGLSIKRSMGIKRGKNDIADSKTIALYAYRFMDQLKPFTVPGNSLLSLRVLFVQRERIVSVRQQLVLANKNLECYNREVSGDVINANNALIKKLEEEIKETEARLESVLMQNDELKRLYLLMMSIPCIGLQITTYMLIVTNGMKSFNDTRKFACYCGVAPFEYTSGTSIRGKARVSHLANKKMKEMLHMAALNAIRFDEELKNYYQRKKAEGKHTMNVLNAVKFKLIGRIFSVVRRGESFQKNYINKVASHASVN